MRLLLSVISVLPVPLAALAVSHAASSLNVQRPASPAVSITRKDALTR